MHNQTYTLQLNIQIANLSSSVSEVKIGWQTTRQKQNPPVTQLEEC